MPALSKRTQRLVEKGNSSPLGAALFATFANQYNAETNSKGVVNAGLAENVSGRCQPAQRATTSSSVELTFDSSPFFNRGSRTILRAP